MFSGPSHFSLGHPIRINLSNLPLKNRCFTHAVSTRPTRRGVERSHRHRIFRLASLKMTRHRNLSTSLEAAQCEKYLVLEKQISYGDAYVTGLTPPILIYHYQVFMYIRTKSYQHLPNLFIIFSQSFAKMEA